MGFEIGVHTHHHHVLPRLDFERQRRELEVAVEFLRELTGERTFTVAYPYGFADQDTKRAMKDLDLLGGFTMGRRLITPQDIHARWEIPRFDVNDCFQKRSNEIVYDVFSSLSTGD
jgi:peptidoglycan/xylan/chitin deacetylase (PgdA/CDA1 family)